jgi:ketosteroid isomerase-like protein
MSHRRILFVLMLCIVCSVTETGCLAQSPYAGSANDRESLAKTGAAIRDAFTRGDVEAIMAYHHPDVIKALGYNHYLVGGAALKADLTRTLQSTHLEFKESRMESLLFEGNTAVEESLFTIEGTPKDGGAPFLIKGRSMVVYVRYKGSPSGWASIREIIQPAS